MVGCIRCGWLSPPQGKPGTLCLEDNKLMAGDQHLHDPDDAVFLRGRLSGMFAAHNCAREQVRHYGDQAEKASMGLPTEEYRFGSIQVEHDGRNAVLRNPGHEGKVKVERADLREVISALTRIADKEGVPYHEDGNLCPVCAEPPEITCKCPRSESRCANGHEWHTCSVHRKVVMGKADHRFDMTTCTCEDGTWEPPEYQERAPERRVVVDFFSVICPHCNAQPGEPCHAPEGVPAHRSRLQLAWLVALDTEGGIFEPRIERVMDQAESAFDTMKEALDEVLSHALHLERAYLKLRKDSK